jgi:DNA-binding transcriptional LysR family regulator
MSDRVDLAEAFLQVVLGNGFARAAKALGRSPSAVSRMITELEKNLGAELLSRTTRRLHLTEAGAAYVAHAEALVGAHRAAKDAITELVGGAPHGRLRMSMPVSVGERLLAPHLPEFRARYPRLRLEIDLSDRKVELVEGGFDLALRVGKVAETSRRAQLLGRVPFVLVASPNYVRERGDPAHPADVARHACICVGLLGRAAKWRFFQSNAQEDVEVEGGVHTTSPTLAAQLAVAGLGILRTPEWTVRDELRRGDLVTVMRGWACHRHATGGVQIYAVYAQGAGTPVPLKSRVFVEMVKTVIAVEGLGTVKEKLG